MGFDNWSLEKLTWFPNGVGQGGLFIMGGPAGEHEIGHITTEDTLLSVQALEFAQGVPHAVHYLGEEFTITEEGIIDNTGGTDTTNMFLFIQVALASRRYD